MRRISRHRLQGELDRIVDSLQPYQPVQIILFGSFARGDYHALSDVDLLIVKETQTPFLERIGPVLALCESGSELLIEPLVYTPQELAQMKRARNPFIEHILTEGIVIYERQPTRSGSLAQAGST